MKGMGFLTRLQLFVMPSFFLYTPTAMASSYLVTLSCVDRENPKFEMVVVFDATKGRVVDPNDVTEVIVNENIISFTQQKRRRFETTIYRSTGRYTVWAKDTNTRETIATFGGICTKKSENKF